MSVSSAQTGLLLPNSTAYTPVAPAITFVFGVGWGGGESGKVNFSRYVQEGENEKGERKETYLADGQMEKADKINS